MSGIKSTENTGDNLFHSNEYAKEAYGKVIGATSPQTFTERLRIEKNRQKIKHYRDSMIAREHDRLNRHRMESKNQPTFTNIPDKRSPSSKPHSPVSAPPSKQTFHEPPSRGYNPYA